MRRLLRVVVVLLLLLALVVLAIPSILSTGFVRERVANAASESLGTRVAIADYSFGWLSGVEIRGVSIDNPPGYDGSQKLFELGSMRGDVSFTKLLGGRLDLSGEVDGLALRVVQKADGRTNVTDLGGGLGEGGTVEPVRDTTHGGSGGEVREFDVGEAMDNVRLDLRLQNSTIEIAHEESGVLERLVDIRVEVKKPFGSRTLTLEFHTGLQRPGDATAGSIDLAVRFEADPKRPIEARLDCKNLDLARYRPVVAMFVPPEQITAFAGVVAAEAVRVTGVPTEKLTVDGELTVTEPRFSGPLFADMDIRAPLWTLRPHVASTVPANGDLPVVDVSKLGVDLGFASLNGMPTEAPVAGQPQEIACRFALDLDKLAEFGGSVPPELRGSKSRVDGEVRLPLRKDYAEMPLGDLIAAIRVDAKLTSGRLEFAEQVLENLGIDVALAGGDLRVSTRDGGTLSGGGLRLQVDTSLKNLDDIPLRVQLGIQGADVAGRAVEALQFAVPVLAGLADKAGGDFRSGMDLALELSGPAMPKQDQPWLQWANQWSGSGKLGLQNGTFTPASLLQQLLTVTGQKTKLDFSAIGTDFRVSNGYVETALMKLDANGRSIGFQGKTSLAGAIDYTFDARDLLRAHKDGAKVLEYLGDEPLGAKLVGSLASPQLGMPDVASLVKQAATNALKGEAQKLIEKEAGKLLDGKLLDGKAQDLLKGVLGGDKSGGAAGGEGNTTKPPEQQAVDLLKGVLGVKPTPGTEAKPAGGATGDKPKTEGGGTSGGKDAGGKDAGSPPATAPLDVIRGVLGGQKKDGDSSTTTTPPATPPTPGDILQGVLGGKKTSEPQPTTQPPVTPPVKPPVPPKRDGQ